MQILHSVVHLCCSPAVTLACRFWCCCDCGANSNPVTFSVPPHLDVDSTPPDWLLLETYKMQTGRSGRSRALRRKQARAFRASKCLCLLATHTRIQACLRSGCVCCCLWLTTEFAQYSTRLRDVCAEERLNVALDEGKFIPSNNKTLRRKQSQSEQSTAARYLRPASAVALSVAAALVAYLTAQSAVRT